MFFISVWLTITYNPYFDWKYKLNILLGNRLYLGQVSVALNGIPLFGRNIYWVGSGLDAYGNAPTLAYNYVDNFYIQILQHYGVIFCCIFLVVMTILLFRLKNIYLYIIFLSIAFHCFVDDLQLYFYYNIFWFSVCDIFMNNPRKETTCRKSKFAN